MAKVFKTAAFGTPVTLTMAVAAGVPTVSIHAIENLPEPILMAVRMHARLLVLNPRESS